MLDPQKIYDIGLGQHVIDFVRNFDSEFYKLAWHKRARSDQRDARAELKQPEDVRARDAAKENVTNDSDVEHGECRSAFAHSVKIQKRLRMMFIRTVPGIGHEQCESTSQ